MTLEVDRLARLAELWRMERAFAASRAHSQRALTTLAQRVARGDALADCEVDDLALVAGGRTLLWIRPKAWPEDPRLSPGAPARLWWTAVDDPQGHARGVVGRRRGDLLSVMVDGEPPERLLSGVFHLDTDDPQETFARGDAALARWRTAAAGTVEARLRGVLFGERPPVFGEAGPDAPLDVALNGPQRAAVVRALATEDVAFIHGPPGTGKTRTLVEVIRRAVAGGQRVLACAMSNTATDHLGAGLLATGLAPVRLGHPARVSDALEAHSLDELLAHTDAAHLARKWQAEARDLRRRAFNRRDRGALRGREFGQMMDEARALERDARNQLKGAQRALLKAAPVVCCTAAGADSALLGAEHFDLVVLDEATQVPDPLALVALSRGERAVLAGDPEQLPPTILCPEAEQGGLGLTLFERLAQAHPEAGTLLQVQHRMHADLMAFPSATRYGGRLVAHPAVAGWTLADLGVAEDAERPTPLVLVDCAGKGWADVGDEDGSTANPGQGERTAAEVRRLISRGLPPTAVGVITPYRAQRRLLRRLLADEVSAGLEIDTVDGFQGRENEAIVVDLVRSNEAGKVGFVADRRRLNVALTRAKRHLLLIADTATLGVHDDFAALLEAVESHGAWVSAWNDEAEPLAP
ncbi:MAG: IGHMBP2 family helicase [Myxococcales bacterium]|nr:IGHMBP2 family helicase [Myxococcales bacterium]MCB9524826.1 IGHMBP2 family helicase [Myxococcales bacterium]